jgi:hypothetical protein
MHVSPVTTVEILIPSCAHPQISFCVCAEKEEEEERQKKLAKLLQRRSPWKVRKKKSARKSKTRKSMCITNYNFHVQGVSE